MTNTAIKELEEQSKKLHAEIDLKTAEAKQYQLELQRLQKEVDNAEDNLLIADTRVAGFRLRIQQLKDQADAMWTKGDNFNAGLSAVNILAECHGTVLALEHAILSYAQLRPKLVLRVNDAKRALDEFQQQ